MKIFKNNRKTILIICENCKNEFEKTKTEFKRSEKMGRKHFCSLTCYNEFHKPKIDIKKCKHCGNLISYEKRFNTFCSLSCSTSFNNKKNTGRKVVFSDKAKENIKNANIKKNGIDKYYENPNFCLECNAILPFKKRKNKFCGINCRKIFDKKKMTEFNIYKSECRFNFNLKDFVEEFDFELIKKFGWYCAKNKGNNLNGISRDHMFSISEGFKQKIDSNIISHPANCKLMVHSNNSSKNKKCSISLDDLKNKIENWNKKYKLVVTN